MNQEELNAIKASMSYDPASGRFSMAGVLMPVAASYIVAGKRRTASKLAWLFGHGEWPAGTVTHINGDPSDYRLANLSVGARHKAQVRIGKTVKHLGYYPTVEARNEAIAQYRALVALGLAG